MNLKNKCLEYFNAFSNKSINSIMYMFAGDMLNYMDNNHHATGRDAIINTINNIFENNSIKITVLSLYQEDENVCYQFISTYNGKKTNMMGVMTFDKNGFITDIMEYAGFPI